MIFTSNVGRSISSSPAVCRQAGRQSEQVAKQIWQLMCSNNPNTTRCLVDNDKTSSTPFLVSLLLSMEKKHTRQGELSTLITSYSSVRLSEESTLSSVQIATVHKRLILFRPSSSNTLCIGLFISKFVRCEKLRLRASFRTPLLSMYMCCRSLSRMIRQLALSCSFSRLPPQLPSSNALGGEFKDRENMFCGSMKSVMWLPLIAKYIRQKRFETKTMTSTT